jgi:mannose/fructose/sorbose-specific phosphotransferase system IIB component
MLDLFLRIDDRLVHGQVVTAWSMVTGAKLIMAVNDAAAKSEVQKTLLKMAIPGSVKGMVLTVAEAAQVLTGSGTDRVIVTVKGPADVLRLMDAGVKLESVNVGNMMFAPGKRQITKSVSVDDADVAAFRQIAARGVKLEAKWLPDSSAVDLIKLLGQ